MNVWSCFQYSATWWEGLLYIKCFVASHAGLCIVIHRLVALFVQQQLYNFVAKSNNLCYALHNAIFVFPVDIYILHMQSYTCISWLYVG